MTDTWDVPQQEHQDPRIYARYHRDIYMPEEVIAAALAFLPGKGENLPLSKHYLKITGKRRLPSSLYMPYAYNVVDVTAMREGMGVFRVLIRAPWNSKKDICLVLEGDFEVVTAWWTSRGDDHPELDRSPYEQVPVDADEEVRRQSRPDDWT